MYFLLGTEKMHSHIGNCCFRSISGFLPSFVYKILFVFYYPSLTYDSCTLMYICIYGIFFYFCTFKNKIYLNECKACLFGICASDRSLFLTRSCPLMFSDTICWLEGALLFVHVSNKRGLIKDTVRNDNVLLRMSDVQDWTLPV